MASTQNPKGNLETILEKQGRIAKFTRNLHVPKKLISLVENLEQRVHNTFPGITREHLKGLGILAGSLATTFILRGELPQYIDYFNQKLPWLSNDDIVLGLDIISNTILAPVGFVISSYANGRKITPKELFGQVAFAAAWGIARHWAYIHGFNQFDYPVTLENVTKKTLWFMPYTWFYAYLYTAYSAMLAQRASGSSLRDPNTYKSALKDKLSLDLIKDGTLWTNIGLNLSNLYLNPAPNSKGVIAGLLVVLYNSRVLRYSHEHKQGVLDYIRSIFTSGAKAG